MIKWLKSFIEIPDFNSNNLNKSFRNKLCQLICFEINLIIKLYSKSHLISTKLMINLSFDAKGM